MQLIEFGAPLEMLVVPSIGSMAISNCGEPGIQVPSCSPLKMPGASNDDFAADIHQIEHAAHGVAGSRVGRFLVAASEPAQ